MDLPQTHLLGWWSWPIVIAPGARAPCGTLTGSWHRKEQEVKDAYHQTSLEVPCFLSRYPWPPHHGRAESGVDRVRTDGKAKFLCQLHHLRSVMSSRLCFSTSDKQILITMLGVISRIKQECGGPGAVCPQICYSPFPTM